MNCFGVIAPVQAWSFANSLFDTRQAKRLFGLIGSGASLGAIAGGFLARVLVEPVGGAGQPAAGARALIALGRGHRRRRQHPDPPARDAADAAATAPRPLRDTAARRSPASPYLRLIAAVVFLTAIVTQWTGAAAEPGDRRSASTATPTALTRFNGTFNFALGIGQLPACSCSSTSQALRRFGLAVTILALPLALGFGTALIVLLPAFWPVLVTNAFDQGFRFSVDRPTYELLYLPIAAAERAAGQERHRHRRHARRRCGRRGASTGSLTIGFF